MNNDMKSLYDLPRMQFNWILNEREKGIPLVHDFSIDYMDKRISCIYIELPSSYYRSDGKNPCLAYIDARPAGGNWTTVYLLTESPKKHYSDREFQDFDRCHMFFARFQASRTQSDKKQEYEEKFGLPGRKEWISSVPELGPKALHFSFKPHKLTLIKAFANLLEKAQELYSTAEINWVNHHYKTEKGYIPLEVKGQPVELTDEFTFIQ